MPAPRHSYFTGQMLFLMPNQQCQSTEGKAPWIDWAEFWAWPYVSVQKLSITSLYASECHTVHDIQRHVLLCCVVYKDFSQHQFIVLWQPFTLPRMNSTAHSYVDTCALPFVCRSRCQRNQQSLATDILYTGCQKLVSWSLTSLFSTNMAISETKGQGWKVSRTQWRKASDILTSTLAAFLFSSHPKKGKGSRGSKLLR